MLAFYIPSITLFILFAMGVLTGVLLVVAALLLLYAGAWMGR
jgi:hypothetical protein